MISVKSVVERAAKVGYMILRILVLIFCLMVFGDFIVDLINGNLNLNGVSYGADATDWELASDSYYAIHEGLFGLSALFVSLVIVLFWRKSPIYFWGSLVLVFEFFRVIKFFYNSSNPPVWLLDIYNFIIGVF